jgi:hypothetical protein
MKTTFSKLFLVPLVVFVLASFAMAPAGDAAGRGGGGGGGARAGGGGGGGAHAGGAGGGGRQNAQVNNSRADTRTNDVRSTSVNNVNNTNINRNTNVNVDRNVNVNVNNGCCNNGWDNGYHPVATAAAVTAAVAVTSAVVGSMVRTVPAGCVPVNYGGMIYQQCGAAWYAPQGSQYMVVAPPY